MEPGNETPGQSNPTTGSNIDTVAGNGAPSEQLSMPQQNNEVTQQPVVPPIATPNLVTTNQQQPAITNPDLAKKIDNQKKKKSRKTAIILIIVMIAITGISHIIVKLSAEDKLNKTIEICENYGLYSSECTAAQTKYDVKCSITGKCETEVTYFFFW